MTPAETSTPTLVKGLELHYKSVNIIKTTKVEQVNTDGTFKVEGLKMLFAIDTLATYKTCFEGYEIQLYHSKDELIDSIVKQELIVKIQTALPKLTTSQLSGLLFSITN